MSVGNETGGETSLQSQLQKSHQQALVSHPPSSSSSVSHPRTMSNLRPPSPTSPLGSEAKEFIEPCVEFDATSDLGGRTALHLAIAHRHSLVVNILLSHTGQCLTYTIYYGSDIKNMSFDKFSQRFTYTCTLNIYTYTFAFLHNV